MFIKVFLLFFKYYLVQFVFLFFFFFTTQRDIIPKLCHRLNPLRHSWTAVTIIIDLYHFLTLSWYILNVSIRGMKLKTNYLEIESFKKLIVFSIFDSFREFIFLYTRNDGYICLNLRTSIYFTEIHKFHSLQMTFTILTN